MQISYDTADLKRCCQKREVAEERFGRTYADRLVSEIADAEAFDYVDEWHQILGGNVTTFADNSFQVVIGSSYMATFVSVDENAAFDVNGRIVWASVEYIKLMSISEVQ
ncbi:hypothetical protein G9X64_03960 [Rhizobium sophorae]|jgi:hypothetical protein|uniref:Uncharacterized protein n=1 Tax=Rhizobium sophorae TaxID=1535242 RepID=A0A7Y3WCT3_9HYPH|nr:hypothetical protein [Rhizobium sophorae]NNU35665.1 hypothetical protein [Rhizobium sophorae]CDZ25764.1 Hypothetical protein NGAL_HAMBI490_05980 [Neorhizobium galegae bv. officinalis]